MKVFTVTEGDNLTDSAKVATCTKLDGTSKVDLDARV